MKKTQTSRARQVLQFAWSITRTRASLRTHSSLAPIFIVGCGRSGNTLIRRLLMASNQVYIPPETYVLGDIIRSFSRLSYLPWKNQVHMALGSISASQDFKYFPACDYHSVTSELLKAPRTKQTCADLLDKFYKEWARAAGMSEARWGDKTPMNSFCLDEIFDTFPKAQFVYVQRSPYDVVFSYLRMGRYGTARDAAARWITSNQKCIHFRERNRNNVITVNYEKLTARPSEGFACVFDFLGLDFRQELLDTPSEALPMGDQKVIHYENVNKKISTDHVGRGRAGLSNFELDEIDNRIKHSKLPDELYELM